MNHASDCPRRHFAVPRRRLLCVFRVSAVALSLSAGAAAKDAAPTITTSPATALGQTAMTANGKIHPHGRHTTYYFEYGPTTAYGSKTEAAALPPRLAAFYHESWDEGLGGWDSWLKASHHRAGGARGGFVRFAEPSNNDHNHDNGIGTLHLVKYLYPGPHPGSTSPSVQLGGGDPDFRDARIYIAVRGNNWKPNGSELLWWTQSQLNIEDGYASPNWKRPNWAHTGFVLTDFLFDGKWHAVDYRLTNDSNHWTYGGGTRGYVYGSIDFCQRHLNIDLFHMLAYIDVKNPPTGSIDFDELTFAYRNYSLLLASNGGRLTSSPSGGDDAGRLIDGWRHGKDRAWRSGAKPAAPLEFVWSFERPVTIHTVQLHQNPDWPAKDVEVLVAADGKTFTPLLKRVLPEKAAPNANWAFTLDTKLKAPAGALKVRVLSGYRAEHWGLGEVEVFGTGATMLPDDDLYHVNTDITDLKPGTTYHYRLVATSSAGTTRGPDQTFTTPATKRPLAETGPASRITATSAKLEGRLNALGEATTFYFEYGTDTKYGSQTAPASGGMQITPRTAFGHVMNLKPGTTYHYRLVATSAQGTTRGVERTFRTAAAR
jgi:hypothetical protein